MTSLDTIMFLEEAIVGQGLRNQFKHVTLVLDNATVHKTYEFKYFCKKFKIEVLYTVVRHSIFNPVEHVFRFVKQDLRKSFTAK